MKFRLAFFFGIILFSCVSCLAQNRRYDSSMKIGKVGYRVVTNNRNADKNTATVSPIGFENSAREVSFEIKGKLTGCEVDDLNNDGFPDLVLYVYNGGAKNTGTVIGISSQQNQTLVPIYFPDIVDDVKLREGYSGNDAFRLMEGALLRRFPLYTPGDSTNSKLTGTLRQIFYRVTTTDKGALTFKVTRSYETGKD